jgi:SAM-dependent methyltransferase
MKKLPVSATDFWKERIARAERDGIEHYSVYLANPPLWESIITAHERIIRKETADLSVLDAGCAYGRVSQWVDNYYGVDISPDFIDIARAKYPHKSFEVADLRALPFADEQFDIAVVVSIREMIIGNLGGEVWDEMEKELKRVCKRVLVLEYVDPDNYFYL